MPESPAMCFKGRSDGAQNEMRGEQAKVPDDHPLMIAWEAYRASDEAANSDKWARTLKVSEPMQGQIIVEHPHLVGSLWAAFSAGFAAAGGGERDIFKRIVLDLSRDPLNAKHALAVEALASVAKASSQT